MPARWEREPGTTEGQVSDWADLLTTAPLVAIILALAITVVYLFKSRERLQQEYRESLVEATQALQGLTAEYLEQSYSATSVWQDRLKGVEDRLASCDTKLSDHSQDSKERIEQAIKTVVLELKGNS